MRTEIYSLSENLTLLNYQNAQIILIDGREGKDVIKQETGLNIETKERKENLSSSDIFTKAQNKKGTSTYKTNS